MTFGYTTKKGLYAVHVYSNEGTAQDRLRLASKCMDIIGLELDGAAALLHHFNQDLLVGRVDIHLKPGRGWIIVLDSGEEAGFFTNGGSVYVD